VRFVQSFKTRKWLKERSSIKVFFYALFRYNPQILATTQFTTMDREGIAAARRELMNANGHGA
jgi:hypothetical protein